MRNWYDVAGIGVVALVIVSAIAGALWYIKWSLEQGDPLITALALVAMFVLGLTFATWVALKFRRMEIESQQQQFINNAKENALIMQQQIKGMQAIAQAQQTQNRALIGQQPSMGLPMLPSNDVIDAQFEITGFDE